MTLTMNPDGLSPQAVARKQRPSAGDLPVPNLEDPVAVAAWRTAQHQAWGEEHEPGEARHEPITIGGVNCLSAGPPDGLTVVYLHGGGFCLGSPGTAIPITARLATRLHVVSVDYRLSPEHPCPAAIGDVVSVCEHLAQEGPYVMAGDSAGANLALVATMHVLGQPRSGAELARPRCLALFSPHLEVRASVGRSDRQSLEGAYVAYRAPSDRLVSPLAADNVALGALPPVLLQTTDGEALHGQAKRLAARLWDNGGHCQLQVWSDLWHAWHYHRDLPEAWDAVDRARDWLATTGEATGGTLHTDGR